MGSTNKTTNYELSQFIGTDKPSWLNDYDNDMFKIDAQMKTNATAASNAQSKADTADGKADANALAIGTLDTQINTPSTGLAATVAGNTSDIGTINGAIGNTALPTTAQTLTGAIAEIDTDLANVTNALNNKYVIDGSVAFTVNADGTKTIGAALTEIFSAYSAWLVANPTKMVTIRALVIDNTPLDPMYISFSHLAEGIGFTSAFIDTQHWTIRQAEVTASPYYYVTTDGTGADESSSILQTSASMTILAYSQL